MFIKAQDGNLYNLAYARKIEICALSQPESQRETVRSGALESRRVSASSLFYVLRAFFGENGEAIDLADYDSLEEVENIRDQILNAMNNSFDLAKKKGTPSQSSTSESAKPTFNLVSGQQA